jgi:C4-dicarboxylate-specific signal transduction histidine kinase
MPEAAPAASTGRQLILLLAVIAAVAVAVALAGSTARQFRIEQMADVAVMQAERQAGQLAGELGRFDHLPDIVRFHPSIDALLENPREQARVNAANLYLESVNDAAGAGVLYILDQNGICIASSNWRYRTSFVGVDLSYRPYFRDAMKYGAQTFYAIGTTTGVPGYFFGRAIGAPPDARAVAVVKVEKWQSVSWPGVGRMMIVDGNGVIVLSSEDNWRYKTLARLPDDVLARIGASRQYENVPLVPIGLEFVERIDATKSVVRLPEAEGGGEALALESILSGSDWKVIVLVDLADVGLFSFWVQIVVALVALTLALLGLYLLQRRRAMEIDRAARVALAAANGILETEVQNRTQDLIEANARLRATQEELVHSAKLAAIGQIAAGVTHELSQPMAAIRSLADNANVFLDRGQREGVTGNLRLISDLVDRMSGITTQLKVFARKRPAMLAAVSVRRAMTESLLILDEQIRRIGAHIVETYPPDEIFAHADGDRLGQVFVNVLSNALDAVAGSAAPRIEIEVRQADGRIAIAIRDTGMGLAPETAGRIFEPFFTTKLAGSGLGLGLAISERIMRDFGGVMRARNAEGGGALFVIELPAADAALAEAG